MAVTEQEITIAGNAYWNYWRRQSKAPEAKKLFKLTAEFAGAMRAVLEAVEEYRLK